MQPRNRLRSAMDVEAAKDFCMKNYSYIIKKLSRQSTMAVTDILLSKKHIKQCDYDTVSEERSETECMRKLFKAMEKGHLQSFSTFHQYLVDEQPFILDELENPARSETESEPLSKRPKIDEESVKEPNQSQVQDETDCGSNPNFAGYTLSQLLQHVEEPEQMESLVASLRQSLKEGQMAVIERLLLSHELRNAVAFNHAEFRKININKALAKYLKTKDQAIFPPLKDFGQFFKPARTMFESLRMQTEPEKGNDNTKKSLEEPSLFQEESSHDIHPDAQSTPCLPDQKLLSRTATPMPESMTQSLDSGYDTSTQKSLTLSHYQSDPGQDINNGGTAASDINSGALSAVSQADPSTDTSPNEFLAPNLADAASASTSAKKILTNTPTDDSSAVKLIDSAVTSEPTEAASALPSAHDRSAITHADAAQTVPSSGEFVVDAADSVGAVAVNAGRSNHGKLKKQGNGRVNEKAIQRKKQGMILYKWFTKNFCSGNVRGDQEIWKLKDCIRNVHNREHPRYPLLQVDLCKVFVDPRTKKKKIIEVVDSTAFTKSGALKGEYKFKVQFHLWLLDISEAVILSENIEEVLEKRPFHEEVKQFQRYLGEVIILLFALYKKVQYD